VATVKSFCRLCPTGCGVVVTVGQADHGGKIIGLGGGRGRPVGLHQLNHLLDQVPDNDGLWPAKSRLHALAGSAESRHRLLRVSVG